MGAQWTRLCLAWGMEKGICWGWIGKWGATVVGKDCQPQGRLVRIGYAEYLRARWRLMRPQMLLVVLVIAAAAAEVGSAAVGQQVATLDHVPLNHPRLQSDCDHRRGRRRGVP